MRDHLWGFCLGMFVLLVGTAIWAIPVDLAGDDGVITKEDILVFLESWHKKAGEAGFNSLADISGDGIIDINDLLELRDIYQQAVITPTSTPTTPEPTLTATATPTEAMATATHTSTPPLPTATPGEPTPTATFTSAPPTETPTPGEPTATATFTSTPLPPTATPVEATPTASSTSTPPPPTETPEQETPTPAATQTATSTSTPPLPTETPTPTMTPTAVTFDILDYFPMGTGDTWHYIGWDGGSTDDNFRWTVEETTQTVGTYQATRIRTDTDQPAADRNLDVDFWIADSGNLLYGGREIGTEMDLPIEEPLPVSIPVQTITLNPPVTFGTSGMMIGDSTGGSSSTNVVFKTLLGSRTLPTSIDLTVEYTDLLPTRSTPMGEFTDVLRVVVVLKATVSDFGSFTLGGNTFFLKEGVGMIAQDQAPDQNDAEIQAIDEGTVGGVAVVAH